MRRLDLWLSFVVALVLVNLMAMPALAQLDNGIIEGTVRDATGAAIPNAAVTITETQTNIVYNAHHGDASRGYPGVFTQGREPKWSMGPMILEGGIGIACRVRI